MKKILIVAFFFSFTSNAQAFGFKFNLLDPFINLPNKVIYGSVAWSSGNFTIPQNVSRIKIIVFGGGGSGASCWWGGNTGATAGGAGKYVIRNLIVTPGSTITIIPGSGGSSIQSCYRNGENGDSCGSLAGYNNGNNGSPTTVTVNGTNISANGGSGGTCSNGTLMPTSWNPLFPNNTFSNGTSVIQLSGGSTYTHATFSGGQAGINGNGGSGFLLKNNTSAVGISNGSIHAVPHSGAGGGAMYSPFTEGGANGQESGSGGSGGAIIYY